MPSQERYKKFLEAISVANNAYALGGQVRILEKCKRRDYGEIV